MKRKINEFKHNSNYRSHARYYMFNYFCGQNCLMDFIRTHLQAIVAIAPRREALETPIKVEKEKYKEVINALGKRRTIYSLPHAAFLAEVPVTLSGK